MSEILSGWKDIANYMGKGVRTVQRYERELGLPVRRPSGRTKGSVLATKPELDVWIHAAFHPQPSEEKPVLNLENLKSQASELTALLEQLMQSIHQLASARKELLISQKTVRRTVQRVHENMVQTRTPWKDGSSRVA
jgi:hypothetical protein